MSALAHIADWLGWRLSAKERNAIVARNMLIVVAGGVAAALFSAMIAYCLFSGAHCPIDGLDEAVSEDPAAGDRYRMFCMFGAIAMACFAVVAFLYLRRGWCRLRLGSVMVFAFSLLFVMIWGIADSGRSIADQVLLFASIQFLIAGLIVFRPLDSLLYFALSFYLFGFMLNFMGDMGETRVGDLVYLAILDIVVSWIVYGLFRRGMQRERAIADESRRDELTGAKNRHYLRDDFESFIGMSHFVMVCDVDDFKRFNDNGGHALGDRLLREYFFALREAFGDECTYRYGGDEFLIVSPDFGEQAFLKKAAHCSDQLKSVTIEGEEAQLTFSGGYIFGVPKSVEDFRIMLHEADEELLKVKRTGKKRVAGRAFATTQA